MNLLAILIAMTIISIMILLYIIIKFRGKSVLFCFASMCLYAIASAIGYVLGGNLWPLHGVVISPVVIFLEIITIKKLNSEKAA